MTPAISVFGSHKAENPTGAGQSVPAHQNSEARLRRDGRAATSHGANADSTSTDRVPGPVVHLNDHGLPRNRGFEDLPSRHREASALAPPFTSRNLRELPHLPFKRYGVHNSSKLDRVMYFDPIRAWWMLRDLNIPVSPDAFETIVSIELKDDLDYGGQYHPCIKFINANWVPEFPAPPTTTKMSPVLVETSSVCSKPVETSSSSRTSPSQAAPPRSVHSDTTSPTSSPRSRVSKGCDAPFNSILRRSRRREQDGLAPVNVTYHGSDVRRSWRPSVRETSRRGATKQVPSPRPIHGTPTRSRDETPGERARASPHSPRRDDSSESSPVVTQRSDDRRDHHEQQKDNEQRTMTPPQEGMETQAALAAQERVEEERSHRVMTTKEVQCRKDTAELEARSGQPCREQEVHPPLPTNPSMCQTTPPIPTSTKKVNDERRYPESTNEDGGIRTAQGWSELVKRRAQTPKRTADDVSTNGTGEAQDRRRHQESPAEEHHSAPHPQRSTDLVKRRDLTSTRTSYDVLEDVDDDLRRRHHDRAVEEHDNAPPPNPRSRHPSPRSTTTVNDEYRRYQMSVAQDKGALPDPGQRELVSGRAPTPPKTLHDVFYHADDERIRRHRDRVVEEHGRAPRASKSVDFVIGRNELHAGVAGVKGREDDVRERRRSVDGGVEHTSVPSRSMMTEQGEVARPAAKLSNLVVGRGEAGRRGEDRRAGNEPERRGGVENTSPSRNPTIEEYDEGARRAKTRATLAVWRASEGGSVLNGRAGSVPAHRRDVDHGEVDEQGADVRPAQKSKSNLVIGRGEAAAGLKGRAGELPAHRRSIDGDRVYTLVPGMLVVEEQDEFARPARKVSNLVSGRGEDRAGASSMKGRAEDTSARCRKVERGVRDASRSYGSVLDEQDEFDRPARKTSSLVIGQGEGMAGVKGGADRSPAPAPSVVGRQHAASTSNRAKTDLWRLGNDDGRSLPKNEVSARGATLKTLPRTSSVVDSPHKPCPARSIARRSPSPGYQLPQPSRHPSWIDERDRWRSALANERTTSSRGRERLEEDVKRGTRQIVSSHYSNYQVGVNLPCARVLPLWQQSTRPWAPQEPLPRYQTRIDTVVHGVERGGRGRDDARTMSSRCDSCHTMSPADRMSAPMINAADRRSDRRRSVSLHPRAHAQVRTAHPNPTWSRWPGRAPPPDWDESSEDSYQSSKQTVEFAVPTDVPDRGNVEHLACLRLHLHHPPDDWSDASSDASMDDREQGEWTCDTYTIPCSEPEDCASIIDEHWQPYEASVYDEEEYEGSEYVEYSEQDGEYSEYAQDSEYEVEGSEYEYSEQENDEPEYDEEYSEHSEVDDADASTDYDSD